MAKAGTTLLVCTALGANIRQTSPPHSIMLAFDHTTIGRENPARAMPKRACSHSLEDAKGYILVVDVLDEISNNTRDT